MKDRVIVLGGGIIGLASALEAAARGFRVTVVEAGRPGGQASGAAAGMLAPYAENTDFPDPFFTLSLASLQLYPEWLASVEEASGRSIEWIRSGSLAVAFHEADIAPLQGRMAWQNRYGAQAELIDAAGLRQLEPMLSQEAAAALYVPGESHVYAPSLVAALEEACRRRGVSFLCESGPLQDIRLPQDGAELETEHGGIITGDRLIVAAGAWTGQFERWFGFPLPIHPIRGQICAYAVPQGIVRHMIHTPQAYWTAKGNGTLVCGASEDIAGFDSRVTERGIGRLVRFGPRVFPMLGELEPVHTWAGLRPATTDGKPLIGQLAEKPQAVLASGHYRNGILLAPVTAAAVGALLSGEEPPVPLEPFAPERFAAVSSGRGMPR